MSEKNHNTTRRNVLKKTVAFAALSVGVTGSASALEAQGVKANYIRFEVDNGDGYGQYEATMPDPDAEGENMESDDSLHNYSTYSVAEGWVDGSWQPRYDEYHFDGSESDLSWTADANIRVIVNDQIVQD